MVWLVCIKTMFFREGLIKLKHIQSWLAILFIEYQTYADLIPYQHSISIVLISVCFSELELIIKLMVFSLLITDVIFIMDISWFWEHWHQLNYTHTYAHTAHSCMHVCDMHLHMFIIIFVSKLMAIVNSCLVHIFNSPMPLSFIWLTWDI